MCDTAEKRWFSQSEQTALKPGAYVWCLHRRAAPRYSDHALPSDLLAPCYAACHRTSIPPLECSLPKWLDGYIFGGAYADTTPAWYTDVGRPIVISVFLNTVITHAKVRRGAGERVCVCGLLGKAPCRWADSGLPVRCVLGVVRAESWCVSACMCLRASVSRSLLFSNVFVFAFSVASKSSFVWLAAQTRPNRRLMTGHPLSPSHSF